jgi:hypothetical protein
MVSVTPFCYEHDLGMHLVPVMVQGMGEGPILVYARPNQTCERRYFEDSGGYGRIGERDEFISVPEWARKIASLSASVANN